MLSWLRVDNLTPQYLVTLGNSAPGPSLTYFALKLDGTIVLNFELGGLGVAANALIAEVQNAWVHVCGSFSSAVLHGARSSSIFRNGVESVLPSVPASEWAGGRAQINLAGNIAGSNQPATVAIDELRIYQLALSAAQVRAGMDGTWPSANLLVYYPFDDQYGEMARDASGNNRHFLFTAGTYAWEQVNVACPSLYNGRLTLAPSINIDATVPLSGHEWYGSIADLRFWKRELTDSEIQTGYRSNEFTSLNLLAHYPLNESTGSTLYDRSGNDNHLNLTPANPPVSNVGHLRMDAGRIATSTAITLAAKSFSVCAWVHLLAQPASNQYIINFGDVNGPQQIFGFGFKQTSNNLMMDLSTSGFTAEYAGSESAGTFLFQWHHVCGVFYNPGSPHIEMFKDGGAPYVSTGHGTAAYAGNGKINLGGTALACCATSMLLDELRVWSRTLSAAEVSLSYTSAVYSSLSLEGYWNFDEPRANQQFTAHDLSGNAKHLPMGTEYVSPSWWTWSRSNLRPTQDAVEAALASRNPTLSWSGVELLNCVQDSGWQQFSPTGMFTFSRGGSAVVVPVSSSHSIFADPLLLFVRVH